MNTQKLGSTKLVKVASYLYFIPVILGFGLWLYLNWPMIAHTASPEYVDGSAALGLAFMGLILPFIAYFIVTSPIYAIILAAHASRSETTTNRKVIDIVVIIAIAVAWVWQAPAWISQLTS